MLQNEFNFFNNNIIKTDEALQTSGHIVLLEATSNGTI